MYVCQTNTWSLKRSLYRKKATGWEKKQDKRFKFEWWRNFKTGCQNSQRQLHPWAPVKCQRSTHFFLYELVNWSLSTDSVTVYTISFYIGISWPRPLDFINYISQGYQSCVRNKHRYSLSTKMQLGGVGQPLTNTQDISSSELPRGGCDGTQWSYNLSSLADIWLINVASSAQT